MIASKERAPRKACQHESISGMKSQLSRDHGPSGVDAFGESDSDGQINSSPPEEAVNTVGKSKRPCSEAEISLIDGNLIHSGFTAKFF